MLDGVAPSHDRPFFRPDISPVGGSCELSAVAGRGCLPLVAAVAVTVAVNLAQAVRWLPPGPWFLTGVSIRLRCQA